jgi:hypothetical protein
MSIQASRQGAAPGRRKSTTWPVLRRHRQRGFSGHGTKRQRLGAAFEQRQQRLPRPTLLDVGAASVAAGVPRTALLQAGMPISEQVLRNLELEELG